MFSTILLHKRKVVLLSVILLSCVLVTAWVGDAKYWHEIDWVDVIGEGGSACAMAIWIVFILGSRPKGRVTDLLTLGLGAMMVAFWQDALDEFIRIPAEQWWEQWFESVAMPVGISILTYGLYHWYQEQLVVNDILKKREQFFREHLWLDNITHVNRVDSLNQQLQRIGHEHGESELSLIMMDVDKFSMFNRIHGKQEGDRFLFQLAEFLQLNMRDNDLLIRYAADRFIIILPHTDYMSALSMAYEIQDAIAHFYYRLKKTGHSYVPSVSLGIATRKGDEVSNLVESANQELSLAKQKRKVA
ncbi:GGDEF domain-containing protein [Oceaniserpentilla sp. 4NH20-0058]|uniref:GGDEF domain-containing protein n=1 Tax=Oceaniserpentilla sp. 4NH20-0058 TaxID=3127660 RepID=UPI0031097759